MNKWSGGFQIAAVYIGTIIGAGFATGREIVEFFTKFGLLGFITILLSGYLFIILGTKMMVKAIHIQAKSFEEFSEYLYGPKFSKLMNLLMLVMLLGVCAVMISGAEAVFVEQLGLSRSFGAIFTCIFAFIMMMIGVQALFAVNSIVVPLLLFFNSILLITVIFEPAFVTSFQQPIDMQMWKAVISAISYASFNLALAQAVLVPIATEVNDVEIVKFGGVLGGILLTAILLSSHIILSFLDNPALYEIPMAIVVNQVAGSIFFIYILIIYGEIFTTVIGNLYGLEQQIRRYLSIHRIWIQTFILVIVYLISQINYSTLLGVLYPLFGYISFIFVYLLWKKPI